LTSEIDLFAGTYARGRVTGAVTARMRANLAELAVAVAGAGESAGGADYLTAAAALVDRALAEIQR
jgi:hypothetical protein